MDNLTHTLAGLLLAEATVQAHARPGETRSSFRTPAYVASAIANNVPDLDFLYAGITERPLGYLLHHRGHSHTLPVGIALGVLTALAVAAVARRNESGWSRSDDGWLFGLSCLGPLVHLAMDFTNNYGVHPFWPVYAGWFYGDAVFIVEPFFWAASIPPLIFAASKMVARFVLATVLALGIVACWLPALVTRSEVRLVPVPMAASLTLFALAVTLVSARAAPRARIVVGVAGCWAIASMFWMASHVAVAAVRRSPLLLGAAIRDVVVTPLPANPLCATALVIEVERDEYIIKRAMVAAVPAWMTASRCPTAADGEPTAPLTPIASSPDRQVLWKDEFRAPLHELSELARDNCQAAAFLKFARAPYWLRTGPDELIVGDLRFDRRRGLDFSDLRIAVKPIVCPSAVPSWLPPRDDLLRQP